MHKCQFCLGCGWLSGQDFNVKCPVCDGKGWVHEVSHSELNVQGRRDDDKYRK